MKKLISLLLSIGILLSLTAGLNLSAYADVSGDFEYYVNDDGFAVITAYNGNDSELTIPSFIDRYKVTEIGWEAFEGCTSLKSVKVSSSIEEIDTNIFAHCPSLTEITVDKNNKYFDSRDNCNAIIETATNALVSSCKNTVIPDSVTSIGFRAFSGCDALTSINISENINNIGSWAFDDCASLESITVDKNNLYFDSRNNCNAIIYSSTDELLYGCKNTVIPDTVSSIGHGAFAGCAGLKDIVIPDNVYFIDKFAFENCTSLTKIIIPEDISVISGETFYGCTSLTDIIIPNTVTKISYGAFEECSALTDITIPDSVTEIGTGAFEGCTSLTGFIIPDGVTEIESETFQNCASLKSIFIPDSITKIGSSAFENCTSLTRIELPKNLEEIGYEAFYGCNSLVNITIDKNNRIFDSRDNCNAIINTETNTVFYGCKNTVIPDSVTKIGGSAFSGCAGLTSIDIPDSVTSIGAWAFFGCENLKSITIPASVTEIDYGIFQQCNNLEIIIVDKNNKVYDSRDNCNAIVKTASNEIIEACANTTFAQSVNTIGDGSFGWRKVPEEMVIPAHITKIDAQAFAGSTLKDVTILNGSCDINNFVYEPNTGGAQWYTFDEDVVIRGYKDSTAQIYADTHGNKFVALSAHPVQKKFTDLKGYDYYNEFITYTSVYNEFLKGTNPPEFTEFSPTTPITRAMFVTILYRMAGEPYKNANPYPSTPFTDITNTSVYYYDAACWALDKGITNQTTFKPFDNVTREQTASFLFRYAQDNDKLGDNAYKNVNLADYPDFDSVHGWAVEAMQWANFNGMITGTQQKTLNPQGATQRIHATKILYGFGRVCNIGNFA